MSKRTPHNGLTKGAAAVAAPTLPLIAPETFRPGPWRVRNGSGRVNPTDQVMEVPLDLEDPHGRHVRTHELLHTRCTPADYLQRARDDGRSWIAAQACEDGRLGAIARATNLRSYTTTSPIDTETISKKIDPRLTPGPSFNPHEAAALMVAAHGTAIANDARARIGIIEDQAVRVAVSRAVEEAIGIIEHGDGRAEARSIEASIAAARIIDELRETVPSNDPASDDARNGSAEAPGGEYQPMGCAADPALVHAVYPPLTIRAATRTAVRRRSEDSGRLSRPAEAINPMGGQPFTRKRRTHGGVVVIDTSGSMHCEHADLAKLVQAAPGAFIVTYSSRTTGGKVDAYVVGNKGRICTPEHLYTGGGNHNDASVLAWAAANGPAGPRVWVSDGITGNTAGTITPGSILHARRTAARLNYTTVPSITEALA